MGQPTHNTFVMGELTPRETEVAELLIQGVSQVEIGKRLQISKSTVRSHVERMLLRFNIFNCQHPRVALAAFLRRK